MKNVEQRFLEYVKFDTQSVENATCFPSSSNQLVFADFLVKELKNIGLQDAYVDDYGYVFATIKSNSKKNLPVLGFIAHMDTSPSVSGVNVKPQVIDEYKGGDIVLNKQHNIVLSPKDYPNLKHYAGNDLIVTDGTTLLGADDKAGVAEIISMAEKLTKSSHIEHGDIKIAFTPDEEVGQGTDHFNVKKFSANYAYTVDGGELGEIEYENFNAANAKVVINGVNIHPGSAKNKMKNSVLIAQEFISLLPKDQNPAYTEHYEGFFHVDEIKGDVEKTEILVLIRDHDFHKFEKKKQTLDLICDFLNKKYGEKTIGADIKDSYFNMQKMIKPHFHLIDNAKTAMKNVDVEPIIKPIRGGTDGARLSYNGLPCPNICTGGANFHSRYEFISVQSMRKTVDILIEIVKLYSV